MTITISEGAVTLKGSHRMGDGRIFFKKTSAPLFLMTASNEPNLGQIHLSTFNKLRFDFFILGILYEQMKVSNTYSGTGQVVVKDAALVLVSEKLSSCL